MSRLPINETASVGVTHARLLGYPDPVIRTSGDDIIMMWTVGAARELHMQLGLALDAVSADGERVSSAATQPVKQTPIEILGRLAMADPIASVALGHHKGGMPLDECLIMAAEIWSARCREADLAAIDVAVRQPPSPIVLVTPDADIERIKARLKATS
jgi:hypothetical protein